MVSVRHPRTRPMTFVNGNRVPVRVRVVTLSTRMKCSAKKHSIEQREPTELCGARITETVRIIYGSQIHLAACVELLNA